MIKEPPSINIGTIILTLTKNDWSNESYTSTLRHLGQRSVAKHQNRQQRALSV